MSLFWRVFAANAAILIVGTLVLVVYPGTAARAPGIVRPGRSADRAPRHAGRQRPSPAASVPAARSGSPSAWRPPTSFAAASACRSTAVGEIGALERTFNRMLERLEKERRDAGAHALQAQEEERQRLARGLHDEVGQSMTAVLLQLKRLAANASPEQRTQLAEAQEVVKTSLDDVRRLAQELRPELLDHLGLASALAELASGFEQRTHVRVRRQLERDLPPLDPQRRARPLPCRPGELDERRPSRPGQRGAALARARPQAASSCGSSITGRDSIPSMSRVAACAASASGR